jgi:MinD superfamily P-loop ATPase
VKELVVISGKGGTGKTSITAAFAALSENAVHADCDVDAADLHLILSPEVRESHQFFSGNEAVVRSEDCSGCGLCETLCRFDAIQLFDDAARVSSTACEGCGVCVDHCPCSAIDFPSAHCGEWFRSGTRLGRMIHARLGIGAENSGKLVSTVRQQAKQLAKAMMSDWIITDGPPGTGCAVIASITGADAVLVVTEPTLSGQHDLLRVLELTQFFKMSAFVCINKWDINPKQSQEIEAAAAAAGAIILDRVPYDKSITEAQIQGVSVVEMNAGPASTAIRNLWGNLCQKMK